MILASVQGDTSVAVTDKAPLNSSTYILCEHSFYFSETKLQNPIVMLYDNLMFCLIKTDKLYSYICMYTYT